MESPLREKLQIAELVKNNKMDELVNLLKEKNVSVNSIVDPTIDDTALHVAARYGYLNIIKALVEDFGADVDARNKRGLAAVHEAVLHYQMEVVKFLVTKNDLHFEDVKKELNEEPVEKFFVSVKNNDIASMKQLIQDQGIEVNVKDKTAYHRTALHVAATAGFQEIVECLVDEFKADVNIYDDIGELPIHNAYDKGHKIIAKFLAERGSRVEEEFAKLLE